MSSKKARSIKFDLSDQQEQQHSSSPECKENETDEKSKNESKSTLRSSLKFQFYKSSKKQQESEQPKNSSNIKKKTVDSGSKEKTKLARYLSETKQIVQKQIEIDDAERTLLDNMSNAPPVDLDKYFKLPELKAKSQLWKIPIIFRYDDYLYDNVDENKVINRFGEGVSDGCNIGLNLPKVQTKPKSQFATWNALIEGSEEALKQFSQFSQCKNRRGSILAPQHMFLTPNPEVGWGERFLLSKRDVSLRSWSSEIFIDATTSSELLDTEYKMNILKNVSICDLSNMLYADTKLSWTDHGLMSESDLNFFKAISKRRRQSLVPPNFGGANEPASSLAFRRQSLGGQIWSTELETDHQRDVYQEKVSLINPDYRQQISLRRLDSIATTASEFELLNAEQRDQLSSFNQNDNNNDHYPKFNPEDEEQARLFAIELTLIIRKYFNSIKSSEIINFMTYTGGQKILNGCAHIKGMLHFHHRIVRLIASYVLKDDPNGEDDDDDHVEYRVQAILFFIHVIRALHDMNNWHSVNLVTQSLQCPPVVRLKQIWRKITFNHPDDYCYFIQISEDLAAAKQLDEYDGLNRYIPIFEDVIEMIKERCGWKIVQIQQHRLGISWSGHHDDTMNWITEQVGSLMKEASDAVDDDDATPTDNNNKNFASRKKSDNNLTSTSQKQQTESGKSSTSFFHRISRKIKNNNKNSSKNKRRISEPTTTNTEKDQPENYRRASGELRTPKMDESGDDDEDNIYQRRLLKGTNSVIMIRRTSKTKNFSHKDLMDGGCSVGAVNLPTCKEFWSLAEYYKLRPVDRELVKQEIVRTLVSYQKKTFYVFEDRSPEIRDFLLNAKCESMDACMRKSKSIGGGSSDRQHRHQQQIDLNEKLLEDDDNRRELMRKNNQEQEQQVEDHDLNKCNQSIENNDGVDNNNGGKPLSTNMIITATTKNNNLVNGHVNQVARKNNIVINNNQQVVENNDQQQQQPKSTTSSKNTTKRRVMFAD